MDEFERTIAELEAIMTDPELDKLLSDARDLNIMLADMPVSDVDSYLLVDDLNKQWIDKGFMNKRMHVTGSVRVGGNYGDVEHVSEIDTRELTDHAFTSRGFTLLNVMHEDADSFRINQQLVMKGRIALEGGEYQNGVGNDECAIILDPTTLIECRERTPAKVAAWLEIYYPEIKQQVDACLVGAEDEAGALTLLAQTSLSMDGVTKRERKEQKLYLESYIREELQFETHVPYIVEFLGECKEFDRQTRTFIPMTIMSRHKCFASVGDVGVRRKKGTNEYEVWIGVTLIGNDKTGYKILRMPASTVYSMESIRSTLSEH